ncbi:hypothetical protein ES705_26565 [subsurface metagenome]
MTFPEEGTSYEVGDSLLLRADLNRNSENSLLTGALQSRRRIYSRITIACRGRLELLQPIIDQENNCLQSGASIGLPWIVKAGFLRGAGLDIKIIGHSNITRAYSPRVG